MLAQALKQFGGIGAGHNVVICNAGGFRVPSSYVRDYPAIHIGWVNTGAINTWSGPVPVLGDTRGLMVFISPDNHMYIWVKKGLTEVTDRLDDMRLARVWRM